MKLLTSFAATVDKQLMDIHLLGVGDWLSVGSDWGNLIFNLHALPKLRSIWFEQEIEPPAILMLNCM